MLEQDTKNVEVKPIDSQQKSSAGKDPLRFTPSKRMFLTENFRIGETPKKKNTVSCLKSNSKILKKKRHKDKLKLFKLDKHLWDPTSQIPQLGKSAKYFKKKDKVSAKNVQMGGSQVSGKQKSICVERANKNWQCHRTKPLEYTFDILCTADSNSLHPHVKKPEETHEPLGKVLLDISSSFQEVIPVPNADVTNKLFLGDLIDLGTPETFESKVGHCEGQYFEPPMDKVDELDNVSNSNTWLPSLSPLMINSEGLFGSDVETSVKTHIISEVKCLASGELVKQYACSTALIKHDHNDSAGFKLDYQCQSSHSELSKVPSNSNTLDERVSSPLVFYGFPGLNSPTSKTEKQLTSHRPRQMLVGILNKYPFPKVVRETTTVFVRRRAFSMDDTLMASLSCRKLDGIVDAESTLEVDRTEENSNVGSLCPQTSGLDCSSKSEPIECAEDSKLEVRSDSANYPSRENVSSNSNEIILNDSSEYPKDTILESNMDIVATDYGKAAASAATAAATRNRSVSAWESGPLVQYELSDVNIIKEDANSSIPENPLPPLIAEACKNHPDNIEGAKEADDLGLTYDSASDNIPPTEDQFHLLACTEQPCESPVENEPSKSSTTNDEELGNGRNSSLQLQVSSNLDVTMSSSPNTEKETSHGIVDTSEMGLLVNGKEDVSDQNCFPPDKNAISGGSYSDAPVICFTDLSTLDADENINDTNDGSGQILRLDPIFTNIPPVDQGNPVSLGMALYSQEQSNTNVDESNSDRDLEKYSDHTIVNTSAGPLDQSNGGKKGEENIADEITAPTEEIITPAGLILEDGDSDLSFGDQSCMTPLEHWVLPPGKKFRRSLSIIRNLDEHPSGCAQRGRHYEISVEEIVRLQGNNVEARTPVQTLRKRLSMRRSSWMRQVTPPPVRRSTFIWSPTVPVPDRGTLYETPHPRTSIYSTPMQQNLASRMSVRTPPMHGTRRTMRSPFNQDCYPASPIQYTIRDLILTICKQTETCSFSDILNEASYEGGCKLGEGVFGEVFSINRDGQHTVLKIIPIEGQQLVNGEKQKTYQEVLSELVIAKVLDELRYEGSDESNQTSGYAQLIATSLVQGSYPETLLQFWEEFDQTKGSDNENPRIFDKEQLFIVMEQGNGGKDLESYTFSSAKQSLSIFKQIAFSLAVAEISVEFEHRDLHWGNVLVSKTSEKQIFYTLNGIQCSVASNGVKCTIIDYTLSRIKYISQVPIYNDIGKDPEMFIATGDYQFDIYRLMKKDVDDDWSRFAPKTNARWLHYLLDKMLTKVKYQRKTAKVHKDSLKVLEEISRWVEDSGSALSIALRLAESKH